MAVITGRGRVAIKNAVSYIDCSISSEDSPASVCGCVPRYRDMDERDHPRPSEIPHYDSPAIVGGAIPAECGISNRAAGTGEIESAAIIGGRAVQYRAVVDIERAAIGVDCSSRARAACVGHRQIVNG